ncbi:MAG: CapA family protein [Cyclobacteriaceae bacterium]
MKGIQIFILLIVQSWISLAQDKNLSILFLGDVMQHQDQIDNAYNADSGRYVYDSFKYVEDIFKQADLTIANLEFTMAGPPYTGYPTFCAPDDVAADMKKAGVDVFVTANNHSCDKRRKGLVRTVDVLDSLGILHTGTYKDLDDKKANFPLVLEKNGFRLGLLNYTYGTNGIPVPEGTIVDHIDLETIRKDINLVQTFHVDKVILFFHWGYEYQPNPSKQQLEIAAACFQYGADIIIGSHPHVLQRMENRFNLQTGKDEVVVYSLGNFISHQRTIPRDGGAMFQLNLTKNDSTTWVESAGYYLTWVHNPHFGGGREDFFVLPASKFEQTGEVLGKQAFDKMGRFIKNSRNLLQKQNLNVFEYVFDLKAAEWTRK